jgi:hypothetical protein
MVCFYGGFVFFTGLCSLSCFFIFIVLINIKRVFEWGLWCIFCIRSLRSLSVFLVECCVKYSGGDSCVVKYWIFQRNGNMKESPERIA